MNTVEILRQAMPSVTQAQHDRYALEAKRRRARARRAARRREARRQARSRETRPITNGFEALHRKASG